MCVQFDHQHTTWPHVCGKGLNIDTLALYFALMCRHAPVNTHIPIPQPPRSLTRDRMTDGKNTIIQQIHNRYTQHPGQDVTRNPRPVTLSPCHQDRMCLVRANTCIHLLRVYGSFIGSIHMKLYLSYNAYTWHVVNWGAFTCLGLRDR